MSDLSLSMPPPNQAVPEETAPRLHIAGRISSPPRTACARALPGLRLG